jgi:hypothetical protein
MNAHRKLQNIRLPESLRPRPTRTSLSRTVRDIRPTVHPDFTEIGKAVVFDREVTVATKGGRYWVIIEMQTVEKSKESALESPYLAAKKHVDALVAERARRWIADPDLYFAPDARDRELVGQIHEAKREFLLVEARYLSTRGELVLLGCVVGEHKYCKRRVKRDGAMLTCACPCHETKEV